MKIDEFDWINWLECVLGLINSGRSVSSAQKRIYGLKEHLINIDQNTF